MSRIDHYYSLKKSLEELSSQVAKLESDPELKKALEFQEKLQKLMSDYSKTETDVLLAIGIVPTKTRASSKRTTGVKRALKVYKNPNTGEQVQTRGGNHKTLNAWRQQYGKQTVDSWLQA